MAMVWFVPPGHSGVQDAIDKMAAMSDAEKNAYIVGLLAKVDKVALLRCY